MRNTVLTGLLTAGFVPAAFGGAFVSTGDLVVATLDSTTNAAPGVALREFSITGAPTLVNTVQYDLTGANALRGVSSTGYRDGVLSRSADGQYLVYTGYRQDSATADPVSSVATPRVIGLVNGAGVTNASVAPTGIGTNPIRSGATSNGIDLWYTADGTVGSLSYIKNDGTNQSAVSPSGTSYRSVFVTSTTLFGSTGTTGTVKGIHDFAGLPTTTVATNPPTINGGGTSYSSIVAEDLSNAAGAEGIDTIYAVGDSLTKFTKSAGVWNQTFSLSTAEVLFGVADQAKAGGGIDLFVSTPNNIYRLLDGGYGTVPTLTDGSAANFATPYLTAAPGTQFRGIAFAVPEPASLAVLSIGAMSLLRRRR